jgi:hypothetical protein
VSLRQRLERLPRGVYWIGGAAIALTGAVAGRIIADRFPLEDRVPIWLAGSAVIFLGLAVLSRGARGKRDAPPNQRDR